MSEAFDVSSLLGLFLDEAREQVESIERNLLALPIGVVDEAGVAEAFRAAHAIKGSARTMGFESVGAVAHELEDKLERLRHHPLTDEAERRRLLDDVDLLKKGLVDVASPKLTRVFQVRLDENCPMKSVRAELLLQALELHATVVATDPARATLDHERFTVTLESQLDDDALIKVGNGMPEVVEFAPESASEQVEPVRVSGTVRVPIERLDRVVDLAGEFVVQRAKLLRIAHSLAQLDGDAQDLQETVDHLANLIGELQHLVMGVRLLPVEGVFSRLVRTIHDVAGQLGKSVDVKIEGGDTEVDRTVLDVLADPLIHMVRNSVDHGIEAPDERETAGKTSHGQITLRAFQEGGTVRIEVIDDGRGIDPRRVVKSAIKRGIINEAEAATMDEGQKLNLIFRSGFSTADEVSEVSGRGVGMDIVRANLEKVGGAIYLTTELGAGSQFTISLPVSLSIIRCLLVESAGEVFAIPEGAIAGTGMAADLPSGTSLSEMLGGGTGEPPTFEVSIFALGQSFRIGVDRLLAQEEVALKPLASWLPCGENLMGASILADGRVVLVVDPTKLVEDAPALDRAA